MQIIKITQSLLKVRLIAINNFNRAINRYQNF